MVEKEEGGLGCIKELLYIRSSIYEDVLFYFTCYGGFMVDAWRQSQLVYIHPALFETGDYESHVSGAPWVLAMLILF